ncbi:Crp/Fnr family transcriptional regulator [Enterovirga rhinocerotis]|uniref:CRP/FNR family transcriptional regulator n=1 Tax=Enterovirga rhinocerotis TaxID=1339210 RepID=A0A4V3DZ03_9HYPH|nr:cyclic nucleotide-binding domain-containing protein [Enterovirga rhinocerotis]TDR94079.1 CRP/FNR family transcriptional regulator [Enterovirga rhinocerotis]
MMPPSDALLLDAPPDLPAALLAPQAGCMNCDLRPVSICGALVDEELAELAQLSERRSFAAREVLTIQGDRSDVVFNVLAGTIRLYSLLPDGRRQIVGFLLPGDFLGLSMEERSPFCADAVVDSRACCFRRAGFQEFLDRKPHLLRRLHRAAVQEMTMAQHHLVLLGKARAEVRVLSFLLHMRRRWSAIGGRSSVTVPLPMSRQDIADYIGLTISTVSRTLTALERDRRILIVPDGVRLLDLPGIEASVAGG